MREQKTASFTATHGEIAHRVCDFLKSLLRLFYRANLLYSVLVTFDKPITDTYSISL